MLIHQLGMAVYINTPNTLATGMPVVLGLSPKEPEFEKYSSYLQQSYIQDKAQNILVQKYITMKVLALVVLGVTLYVISGEQVPSSDRQARQMPFFNGMYNPYAVHSFFDLPSAPYYGLVNHDTRLNSEQNLFRSNAKQEVTDELPIKNKQPIIDDGASARLFLGGATVGYALPTATNNYLIKTSFVYTTATGTVCKLSTCIPSTLFADAAGKKRRKRANESASVICRRKRDVLEILGETGNIEASLVQPVSVTTILDQNFKPVPEERQMVMSPYPVLESSLDDPSDPNSARTKRFAFILTTTLTTYELVSTTYTVTIKPGEAKSLTCRPSGYGICA